MENKQTNTTLTLEKKTTTPTLTEIHSISQIQFTIKYHTALQNVGYKEPDSLNVVA